MAIGFVKAAGTGSTFGGNPSTASFTPAAPGNCLVVASVSSALTGNVSSISDTAGNTWVNVFQDFTVSLAHFLSVWVAPNCKAAATVVTVAYSSQQTFGADILIAEYSGVSQASAVDVSGIQNSATSPFSTPTKITTVANDWILAIATSLGAALGAPAVLSTAGYSVRENEITGRFGLLLVDSNAPNAVGAYSVAFTSSGATNAAGLIALEAPAAPPPSGGPGTGLPPFGWVNTQGDHYNKRGLR